MCAALREGDMVGKEGDVSGNRSMWRGMLTEGRQARMERNYLCWGRGADTGSEA